MAKSKNKYNVYVDGELYMENLTIREFCDKTGAKADRVRCSVFQKNKFRGIYHFEKINCEEEETKSFRERWEAVIKKYYANLDWKKIGVIPIVAEEKSK